MGHLVAYIVMWGYCGRNIALPIHTKPQLSTGALLHVERHSFCLTIKDHVEIHNENAMILAGIFVVNSVD